jgi:dihydroxy-acid dehydratase
LADPATHASRLARWRQEADGNGGVHPLVRDVDTRLLRRMRACALPALLGGGLSESAAAADRRETRTG